MPGCWSVPAPHTVLCPPRLPFFNRRIFLPWFLLIFYNFSKLMFGLWFFGSWKGVKLELIEECNGFCVRSFSPFWFSTVSTFGHSNFYLKLALYAFVSDNCWFTLKNILYFVTEVIGLNCSSNHLLFGPFIISSHNCIDKIFIT